MATIKIHDLNSAGSQFFSDSETYLTELTDDELSINGGLYFSQSYGVSISQGQGRSLSWGGYSFSVGRSISLGVQLGR